MAIINTFSLESNKKIKINFNGGDLSSDAGLLLIKEFAAKAGLIRLVNKLIKTNDPASFRIHTDPDNLMQIIYQLIASYFEDDCADELTNDPIMTAILEKESLASQPTLSRFFNRMTDPGKVQLIPAKKRSPGLYRMASFVSRCFFTAPYSCSYFQSFFLQPVYMLLFSKTGAYFTQYPCASKV